MGHSERPRPLGLNCDLLWEMEALVINRADRLIHQTRYIRSDIAVSLLGGRANFKAIFAIWHYMLSSPLLLQPVCFHELNGTTLFSSGEAAYCRVCTRQEFLRNMTRTQDYKVSAHQESVIGTHTFIMMIYNNNNLLHLYSAFLGTQSALHSKGLSPHPPPMCSIHLDDATAAILRQNAHHKPAYWWRQSDGANQCMGMIRRPWWSEANGRIWSGCRGHTSTLFEIHPGIFNDHKESGPRFNISCEGWCFLQYSVPVTTLGR